MLNGKTYKSKDGTKIITPENDISLGILSKDFPGSENFGHPYYWSSFTLVGNPW